MPHTTEMGMMTIATRTRSAFFWRRSSSSPGSAPILVSHVALAASQPTVRRAPAPYAVVVPSTAASSRVITGHDNAHSWTMTRSSTGTVMSVDVRGIRQAGRFADVSVLPIDDDLLRFIDRTRRGDAAPPRVPVRCRRAGPEYPRVRPPAAPRPRSPAVSHPQSHKRLLSTGLVFILGGTTPAREALRGAARPAARTRRTRTVHPRRS